MLIDIEKFAPVSTQPQIETAIHQVYEDAIRFLSSLTLGQFFEKGKKGWSAAENAEHILKATRLIELSLLLPRFSFYIFGSAKRSRTFLEVVELYQSSLENGGKAGVFAPLHFPFEESDEERKNSIIEGLKESADTLSSRMKKFSEENLDTLRMPHPVIGENITLREMMFFCIYHVAHHMNILADKFNIEV